jgi:hypothetical protein
MAAALLLTAILYIGQIQGWQMANYADRTGVIMYMLKELSFHGSLLLFFLGLYQKTN